MNKTLKNGVLAGLVLSLLFVGSACTKTEKKELKMSQSSVKSQVTDWVVYTNPAYRYEFRFPNDWSYSNSGEDGEEVKLFKKNSVQDIIKIKAYSNWQDKVGVEEYYNRMGDKLFTSGYEREEIKLAGREGIWFKNVTGRVEGQGTVAIDMIVLDVDDRIIEINVYKDWGKASVVLNTLYFYSDKVLDNIQ